MCGVCVGGGVPWERLLRNKQWLPLPDRPCAQPSNRLAACASRSSVRQPKGCHLCWNETLLALRFDASPRPRSGCVESIGNCLISTFSVRTTNAQWRLDAGHIHASSSYWPVYNFFASQSLHNRFFFKKKSGDVNDEVNFPFFILLHKRAKQRDRRLGMVSDR